MSTPNSVIDLTDDPQPSPLRYRAWRRWCDEHGEGPYLYEFWGMRWGFFLTLTFEKWLVGVEYTRPNKDERWLSFDLGPLAFHVARWTGQ